MGGERIWPGPGRGVHHSHAPAAADRPAGLPVRGSSGSRGRGCSRASRASRGSRRSRSRAVQARGCSPQRPVRWLSAPSRPPHPDAPSCAPASSTLQAAAHAAGGARGDAPLHAGRHCRGECFRFEQPGRLGNVMMGRGLAGRPWSADGWGAQLTVMACMRAPAIPAAPRRAGGTRGSGGSCGRQRRLSGTCTCSSQRPARHAAAGHRRKWGVHDR